MPTYLSPSKLSQRDLIWLTAFFEGEGYAGFMPHRSHLKKDGTYSYTLTVKISQNGKWTAQYLKKLLGFGMVGGGSNAYPNHFSWTCHASLARYFLNWILPHMRLPHKIYQVKRALKLDASYMRKSARNYQLKIPSNFYGWKR